MENLTFMLFFVGGVVATCTFYAIYQWKQPKRKPDPRVLTLMKQMGDLQIELADLRDLYERLMTSHKRLRSSAGMAKLRGMDEQNAVGGIDRLRELGLIRGKPV